MQGYRTYFIGGLLVLAAVGYALGFIDRETLDGLVALFGGAGLWTLRAAIK